MNGFSDYKTSPEYAPIRKMLRRRLIKSVLISLLIEAGCIGIGIFWSTHTGFGNGRLAIVLMGIIGLGGVKISGLLDYITDKNCEGKIIEIKEVTGDKSKTAYGQMINFDSKISKISIYVQKPDGSVKLYNTSFEKVPHDYYKVGDEVRHYRGLKLFEKRDKSKDVKIICNVCESYVSTDEDYCPFCRYKILK
ncbi:MAG: hypothetical protein IJT49_03365 [Clostridia bacterium]|nr:hypothetical protein [Clostridia bacterium]